jgi:hypothetical protein
MATNSNGKREHINNTHLLPTLIKVEQDHSAPVTEASENKGKLLETITSQEKRHESHRRTDSGKQHESNLSNRVLQ